MGAEFWEHQIPYVDDPEIALRAIQIEVFQNSSYDLPKLLRERIQGMEDAIALCEEDDPYHLIEGYRESHRRLHQLALCDIPVSPEAQIILLRKIEALSADSAPGILAIEDISDEWVENKVRVLTSDRTKELFGTAMPSLRVLYETPRWRDAIPRSSGICLIIFDNHQPLSWYLAGYSWY